MSMELEMALRRIEAEAEREAMKDYQVSIAVSGQEFKVMHSVVKRVFNMFCRQDNWKLPINQNVELAEVLKAVPIVELRKQFPGFPEESNAVRSFVASCVSFFVGGESVIWVYASGGLVMNVQNAGYYNNIGA